MKRIALIGSSGSIGQNVLDVVGRHPDDFEIVGMAVHRDTDTLQAQSRQHPDAPAAIALLADAHLALGNDAEAQALIEQMNTMEINARMNFVKRESVLDRRYFSMRSVTRWTGAL